MLWYLQSADNHTSHHTYTTKDLFIKTVFNTEIFLNKLNICSFYGIGSFHIFSPLFDG